MRFRGEMNNGVRLRFVYQLIYQGSITDIAFLEAESRIVRHRREIFEVASVREFIEDNDFGGRIDGKGLPHEAGSDESGSACDQKLHLYCVSQS
jgi:hypothetical protein